VANGRDETRQKERASSKYTTKKAATERIAAQRAAQQRADRRRNVIVAGSATLAVLIVIGVIVAIGVTRKSNPSSSSGGNPVVAAPATVTDALTGSTGVDNAKLNYNALVTGPPKQITGGPALTGSGGKPQVLYVGAEYCPYCAATRWPLTVALSRFGTFSDLKTTYSMDSDPAGPHTPTLSFYKSSYTSPYLDFVGIEHADGVGKDLEPLTSEQNTLFQNIGGGAYPFIDFGGKWAQTGSSFDPKLLSGMTPEQVAKAISDPSSKQGAAIAAGANVFTALICQVDGGQPAKVCNAAGVSAAQAALNGATK
jgi:hypothetical protein